jgi:hypothetical protein
VTDGEVQALPRAGVLLALGGLVPLSDLSLTLARRTR